MKHLDYDDLRKLIREEEPVRPSMRVSVPGKAAATIASQRKCNKPQLFKICQGELDWIVLKTLEKERHRRYETASALAADVERYLRDEPVSACPPSTWYLCRKFARRHRAPLTMAAVVATALLVMIAGLAGSIGWATRGQAQPQNGDQRTRPSN